jgi:flagellar protein FlaF
MSNAAKAYAKTAQTTASPREIEAQALLKAANQLQDVLNVTDATTGERMQAALLFNRKLWSIFLSDAMRDENPQPLEVRQNIANIGVFVMTQTAALQLSPEPANLQPLIDINRNIAAGLSGVA